MTMIMVIVFNAMLYRILSKFQKLCVKKTIDDDGENVNVNEDEDNSKSFSLNLNLNIILPFLYGLLI